MIRRKLLFFYIRVLEWYLDFPSITQVTNTEREFLANAWRHSGYREYAKKRNDILIYEAAGGSAMSPHKRLKYAELIGRRVENLNMSALAKKSFELEEQQKRQKLSNKKFDTTE